MSYVAIMVFTTKKGDTIHPSIRILRKKERKACRSKERVKGVKHKVGKVETQQLQLNSQIESEKQFKS
jgi:hypothetical protein